MDMEINKVWNAHNPTDQFIQTNTAVFKGYLRMDVCVKRTVFQTSRKSSHSLCQTMLQTERIVIYWNKNAQEEWERTNKRPFEDS